MWITNVSPAADAGSPVASRSIPDASMDTWPIGSRRISKIAAGSASMVRWTSIRSAVLSVVVMAASCHRWAGVSAAGLRGPGWGRPYDGLMRAIEVFADIWCPFAHLGLRAVAQRRDALGRGDVPRGVRGWRSEERRGGKGGVSTGR